MKYGHLELRIEELLQEKGVVRIPFVRNWIYRGLTLIVTAEMNSKD